MNFTYVLNLPFLVFRNAELEARKVSDVCHDTSPVEITKTEVQRLLNDLSQRVKCQLEQNRGHGDTAQESLQQKQRKIEQLQSKVCTSQNTAQNRLFYTQGKYTTE